MPTETPKRRTPSPASDQYDPPRVEMSLNAEALEREVLYAGTGGASGPDA